MYSVLSLKLPGIFSSSYLLKNIFIFFLIKKKIFFFYLLHYTAYRFLVPSSGIEFRFLAVKEPSPNHWTAKDSKIHFTLLKTESTFSYFFFFIVHLAAPVFVAADWVFRLHCGVWDL